jgi:NAD-dependent dihydropyrimidine dehydrogenase PreA subunit
MSEQLWEGIPRSEVPWFPTIDVDLCSGCQSCLDTCPGDVYDWDEVMGVPIVARREQCVVYCMGCAMACPEEAITFPNKDDVVELVKQLRVKYAVQ